MNDKPKTNCFCVLLLSNIPAVVGVISMDIQEMRTGWFCPFRVPSGTHETDRAVGRNFSLSR